MDKMARAAIVRVLAAMDPGSFAALVTEARGVDGGEQIAELTQTAQLQKAALKDRAGEAIRQHIGGGQ
jgi:hypothetical protein